MIFLVENRARNENYNDNLLFMFFLSILYFQGAYVAVFYTSYTLGNDRIVY